MNNKINNQHTTALFLGDSIVKGVSMENGRYKVLESSYYNKFKDTVFSKTKNNGKFGLTSEKLLANIEKIKESEPDIVFISIGANDCNYNWKEIAENPDSNHIPAIEKTQFEDNLCSIYDYFLKNNVSTISLNFPPLHAEKFFNFLASKLSGENIMKWLGNVSKIYYHHESYNNIFETVTRSYGIDMIDIRSRFLLNDNLEDLIGIDGMHPGSAGHELIYKSITDHLLTRAIRKDHSRVA
ncbi:MAG: SGNH/GDSL hydrolase family protein [Spirochaetales bacterium]|nr:SGNH/GDSL hydrolase family protein [Spirochaetales bacterium]